MGKISIQLLGQFKIADHEGNPLVIRGRKQQALLIYLALNCESPPSRDKIANIFWGERFDSHARQSLRQAISRLRGILPINDPPILLTEGDQVRLNLDAVNIDACEFKCLSEDGSPAALVKAATLYDNLLADGLQVNEAAFEEWIRGERVRFHDMICSVLARLAAHQADENKTETAIETVRRLIALDPLNEASHRLLMRIYAASGQRALAQKQYKALAALLLGEFGSQPDPETRQLLEEIRIADSSPRNAGLPSRLAAGTASTAANKSTVAVLPFEDLSQNKDQAHFANGILEDIIISLTKYHWLGVIARNSTATIKGPTPDVCELAKELGADYVIRGSVRQMQGRLRVSAQLVDASNCKTIWGERYDRDLKDLFAVQDEITETITATIEPELAAAEGRRASRKPTESLDAWDCYHLGLAHFYQFNRDSNLEAQRQLSRAIEIDPEFAAAHARLAWSMAISAISFNTESRSELLEDALAVARRAVALDDKDAVAHLAIGRVHLARGEHDLSVAELRTSIKLNPCLAQAHCSLGQSLAYSGLMDEAVTHLDEAVRLGPHDPYRWGFLMYGAWARLLMKQHETAAQWAHDAILIPRSSFWANSILVAALGHLDRNDEAKAAVAELLRRKSDFSCQYARARVLRLKDPALLDHYVNGMRKAGLPA